MHLKPFIHSCFTCAYVFLSNDILVLENNPKSFAPPSSILGTSLMAQMVKNLPAMRETLGREDPVEEGMATHSNILAWRISQTEQSRWLTVHGVTKNRTRLSNKHIHFPQYWYNIVYLQVLTFLLQWGQYLLIILLFGKWSLFNYNTHLKKELWSEKYVKKTKSIREFSGDPVDRTQCLHCGDLVQSLFRELRSHKLHNAALPLPTPHLPHPPKKSMKTSWDFEIRRNRWD